MIFAAMPAHAIAVELPPEPAPPSQLSPVARRHIAANGGRLYVWERRRRRWWLVSSSARIEIAMEHPGGVSFNPPTRIDGIDVHLDRRAELWFGDHPYAVVDLTRRRARFEITDEAAA
jgi:hypothetical protein